MPDAAMPRRKQRNPRRHYVPPALLYSRKRKLLLDLIRVLQRIGIEVRISRLRYRDFCFVASPFNYLPPNSLHYSPSPLSPSPDTQREQDTLPDVTSASTPDFLAPSPPPTPPQFFEEDGPLGDDDFVSVRVIRERHPEYDFNTII